MLKLILYLSLLVRLILLPVIYILAFFNGRLKSRIAFEKGGDRDFLERADYLFEVSSEGELEQIIPILREYLSNELIVQLAYASGSVQKKVELLKAEFKNLHILRLPILTAPFYFLHWAKAPSFNMVRYDFYPELLLYGMKKGVKFNLILTTLKGKTTLSFLSKAIYKNFDQLIPSSSMDKKRLELAGLSNLTIPFDYRVLQISERIEAREAIFLKDDLLQSMVAFIHDFSGKKLIFGSFWEEEVELFNNPAFISEIKNGEVLVCIAPHKLDNLTLSEIEALLERLGLKVLRENRPPQKGCVILSAFSGVLCEFYTLFDVAYVGGGFVRSVHSVLEPYLAQNKVICGPKTHRSTEYDLIMAQDPLAIISIEKMSEFYLTYCRLVKKPFKLELLEEFITSYQIRKKEIEL